jgi:hypothetical protein
MGAPNYEEGGDIPGGDSEGNIDFKVVNIGSFFPTNLLSHNSGKVLSMIEDTTATERFNIETYGYGCYAIKSTSLNSYTSDTRITFMKNYDLNTVSGCTSNDAIF